MPITVVIGPFGQMTSHVESPLPPNAALLAYIQEGFSLALTPNETTSIKPYYL